MKKRIIIATIVVVALFVRAEARADSMIFATTWQSEVQVSGAWLRFYNTATIQLLDEGLYGINIPWLLNDHGDIKNFSVSVAGATVNWTTNFLNIENLWVLPGENFFFSYEVPATSYEASLGIVTSTGYIPGPDLVDWGSQDWDPVWVLKYKGGGPPPNPIPEPTTFLLLIPGLLGLVARIKKIKK